ncbi:unnamed protein product [Mycena citricolor]|uniref:Uncharacterized protein n=1 Tax=Mycena citricolor TaxID=2018698 RepID=A0AAD2HX04_9AGAR|nr:unnamed protein product [Mycena citricolor]
MASTTYTIRSLDAPEPTPTGLESLVFHVPFIDDAPARLLQRYRDLRAEREMEEESHYEAESVKLVLEAYQEEALRTEREEWAVRAISLFHAVVEGNKDTLRHVEVVLPTGGMAEPLNLFAPLKYVTELESLSVQWPMRGYSPLHLLLIPQFAHVLENTSFLSAYAHFTDDLISLLESHAATLARLRISLPQSTTRMPFALTSLDPARFPALPHLALLDLTHWSPSVPALTALLTPARLPRLRHLILDHGAEWPATDYDPDEEVDDDYDPDAPTPEVYSWAGLAAHLAGEGRGRLESVCGALLDTRFSYGGAARLRADGLRRLLGLQDDAGIRICTAWPVEYALQEKRAEEKPEDGADDDDLYTHVPGCGHLAYPEGQRPTTGLWPAEGEEQRSGQNMLGKPWY